jgi:hypothetical protein
MKINGFKEHRFEHNPKEKELNEKFQTFHNREGYSDMDFIVFGTSPYSSTKPAKYLTDREKQIVVSTIQWLGSPVGQGFLLSCGFELVKK